jgi:hypothetical protein
MLTTDTPSAKISLNVLILLGFCFPTPTYAQSAVQSVSDYPGTVWLIALLVVLALVGVGWLVVRALRATDHTDRSHD